MVSLHFTEFSTSIVPSLVELCSIYILVKNGGAHAGRSNYYAYFEDL
jgi:hypothetical protein